MLRPFYGLDHAFWVTEICMFLNIFLIRSCIEDPTAHVENEDGRHAFIKHRLPEEVLIEDDLGSIDEYLDVSGTDDIISFRIILL